MKENTVIDNFVFVIVEQEEYILRSMELNLNRRGITPLCISYVNIKQVSDVVKDIHSSGKYPYIYLGEVVDYSLKTDDTRIVQELADSHQKGGVLIPLSLDSDLQRYYWFHFVNESNWVVPEEDAVDIESECKSFLNNLHNDEQSVEFNCIN
ncbi:hypothetical protein GX618_00345 [Candidatus Dojkabacteria bacterium]|uniref:Uncharacterized protein n=1 Tax=Candidatus Dojkabacteria bacterium TaxID=2099670 RepID=A0A847ETS3_9BACT|nr:hypothetical protein [Candidatus Dojkabacteria bacterium]